jgi:hypothetical protein
MKSTWLGDLALAVPLAALGVIGIVGFRDVVWGVGFLVASPVVLLGRRRMETRIARHGITVRGLFRQKVYSWTDIRGATPERLSAAGFSVALVTANGQRVPVEPRVFGLVRAPERIQQWIEQINRMAQAEPPRRRPTNRDAVELPVTLRMAGPTRLLAGVFIALVGVAGLASAVRMPFVGLLSVPLAGAASAILYFRVVGRFVRFDRSGVTARLWRREATWPWRQIDGLVVQKGRFLGQRVSLLIPHGSLDLSELTPSGFRSEKNRTAAWERLAGAVDAMRP